MFTLKGKISYKNKFRFAWAKHDAKKSFKLKCIFSKLLSMFNDTPSCLP